MKLKIKPFIFLFVLLLGKSAFAAIPNVEWRDLTDSDISPQGKAALSYQKDGWKHAETEHFVYHFTDEKEAETVYIHAEVYYNWVKTMFGVTEDKWKKKAHIFVFQNKEDWKDFSAKYGAGIEGEAFTSGWELFIYREPFYLSPKVTLAHEITHVILFRFLQGTIPLSLNEGFAEFMSYKALAMQEGVGELDIRTLKLLPPEDYIPVKEITGMTAYPKDKVKVFYQESEILVRFLVINWKGEKFYDFLRAVSGRESFEKALEEVYGFDPEKFEEDFKNYALKKDT